MAIDMVPDMDRLRGEIDEMRKDLKTLTRTMRDLGAEKGHEALERAEYYGKRARKHAAKTEARIEREIEERPIVSVLAAFGAGFLIAKLFDSGR
jgi:ElaB/YqjD/DUF883 family membrane-anchored ribosome-binding protein